jgi:hypothetical protein
MASLSRRSVAKGAAWSVPAISLVTAAPAFAASIQCPPDPGAVLVPVSGSAPSYNLAALNSTQELLQLNFGAYTVNQAQAPANSTGFYVTITGITIVGSDGATLPFTFTQSAGGSPVINGSGGAISVAGTVTSGHPFTDFYGDLGLLRAKYHLATMQVSYSVTFLDWLDPTNSVTCSAVSTASFTFSATLNNWQVGPINGSL